MSRGEETRVLRVGKGPHCNLLREVLDHFLDGCRACDYQDDPAPACPLPPPLCSFLGRVGGRRTPLKPRSRVLPGSLPSWRGGGRPWGPQHGTRPAARSTSLSEYER